MAQSEPVRLRDNLVDDLKARGLISSAVVEAAFRSVPRHAFVPGHPLAEAYRDEVIPTKQLSGVAVSSLSQPAIMAVMLEQLEARPGHRALEIGSGTGYNAALLAAIVGPEGTVTTVELDEDLALSARAVLARVAPAVEVECADGAGGWPPSAPYHRIIATVASPEVPRAWHDQLEDEGRLVMPLRLGLVQRSVALVKLGEVLHSDSIESCGFVAIRGRLSGGRPTRGAMIGDLDDEPPGLAALLRGGLRSRRHGPDVSAHELRDGLLLWLSLDLPDLIAVTGTGHRGKGMVPDLIGVQDAVTVALLGPGSAALMGGQARPGGRIELEVGLFGDDLELGHRLLGSLERWEAHGRPGNRELVLEVSAPDGHGARPAWRTFETPEMRLAVSWSL